MNGGRGATRQLLVHDGPHERGEVRLRWLAEPGQAGIRDQPGDDGVLLCEEAGRRRVAQLPAWPGLLVRRHD